MTSGKSFSGTALAKIFLAAFFIRIAYDLAFYFAMGDQGLLGVDSLDYVARGRIFASSAAAGDIHNWDWLGRDPFTMPLFAWTTALTAALSQSLAPLTFVLFQGALDSLTCVIVYRTASEFGERIALPAAIFAVINPTQIVMAGLYYPDTQFVFFIAAFLLGAVRWLRTPTWPAALTIALSFSGAALTRILVAPFGFALVLFLLIVALGRLQLRGPITSQIGVMAIIFLIPLGLISSRNFAKYESWSLTPQTGIHLNGWIVPLVREAKDGTPWRKTYEVLQKRAHARFNPMSENPFTRSQQNSEIALEELARLGLAAAIKAWVYGAANNLAAPAIILSPPILQIYNFLLRSDSRLYAQALLIGTSGLLLIRLVQLIGLTTLLRERHHLPALLLLVGWCCFILLVNGPVASPKYRLPIEPVLMVYAGAGYYALRRQILNAKP
jgi:4-amino-4-deoxy-L-arabinose transferase-like glycosyltransferase